jgi:hypothetical protein
VVTAPTLNPFAVKGIDHSWEAGMMLGVPFEDGTNKEIP